MISNMQQQNLDGVVTQILSNDGSPLYINNNNTQKNKNINTLPSSTEVMHNLSPNGLNFYKNDLEKTFDQSSENAKETVTSQASHTNVNVCLSFLDEISELIKKQPSLTESQKESAFNQSSDKNRNQISKTETISSMASCKKPPTIRDEHQENAFRRIEDVHNYSKISRSDESTNSSSQDDEEYEDDDGDDDDGNNIQQNSSDEAGNNKFSCNENAAGQNSQLTSQSLDMPDDEDKTMPEHHARRPMNAFLIFCKRHRAIVREKYKHLENRSITKILGDWWATLDAEEKVCYTNLAKQYKDAFFSANPNFKWYKLPAPPLRTLSTRPSNADRPISVLNYPIANDYDCSKISKDIRSNRIPITGGISYWNYLKKEPSEVGAFKLADETQMGNLSSLMIKPHDVNTNGVTCSTTIRPNVILNISNISADDVQYSSVGESVSTKHEPLENMRDHAIKMENDHLINGKRKLIDDGNPNGYKRPMLLSDNSFSSGDEDGLNKKSARSCKGKKYQEFLNSGQITIFTKKARTKTTSTSNTFPHNNYCKPLDCSTVDNSLANSKLKIDVSTSNDQMKSPQAILDSPVKQFDASDFDLEEKIKALPAQSLEGYLQRKRETKKKKKINSKRYTSRTSSSTSVKGGPKTILEAREQIQNAMVGSQKRKARKESITRRDINAITNDAHNTGHFETVESLVQLGGAVNKIEVDDNDEPATVTSAKQTNTSDLLILAEVATTHIEENV